MTVTAAAVCVARRRGARLMRIMAGVVLLTDLMDGSATAVAGGTAVPAGYSVRRAGEAISAPLR